LSNHWVAEGKYPLKRLNLEIGVLEGKAPKAGPTGIDYLMGVLFRQISPLAPAFRA
jgi:hypothetical protein